MTGVQTCALPIYEEKIKEENAYRHIQGNVWEEIDKTTTVGDGLKIGDGKKNGNDISAQNVLVKLYEVITVNNATTSLVAGEYIVDTGLWYRTGTDGKYAFGYKYNPYNGTGSIGNNTTLHAGQYVVRFIYGDEADKLLSSSLDNTGRIVLDNTGKTIRYSGQDFKNVTYTEVGTLTQENEVVEATVFAATAGGFGSSGNIKSYAKDNEARRLEVNAYSTTTRYPMDNVLKAIDPEDKEILARNTSMYADTKKFDMQVEYYDNYLEDSGLAKYVKTKTYTITKDNHVIKGTITSTLYRYFVDHIDFGLIERPITQLQMMKDITQITAVTSDGTTILDAYFDINYQLENGIFKHTAIVNTAKSKGLENSSIK